MTALSEADQLRRLLQVGRELVSERDPEAVLDRILHEAREITGARYAALGVLDSARTELERFLTLGIDPATHSAIGDLPHGRGVLGVLIEDPRPLRISDVGGHPQSYGFPPGHPQMRCFLGVPIVIRDQGWGNLYLAEKEGASEFTEADEQAVVALAQWAAIAIENARLYATLAARREQLEQAVRALEAARDIADAISGISDLDRILELIVKRGRALVSARSVVILLREGEELVVAASAGYAEDVRGHRIPVAGSTSGQVLKRGQSARIVDASGSLLVDPQQLGVPDADHALIAPMVHHGEGLGVLVAFDRGDRRGEFSSEDEQLLRTFAATAGNAVAINRSVQEGRLRSAIDAADAERGRWARELHDQTLQALANLRVLLASTVGRGDADSRDQAMRQAIDDIQLEIGNLRGIISDLRPSLLDDLGLLPALESLCERRRVAGLEVLSQLNLPDRTREASGLPPELETAIYRLVQESLANVVKHARAERVRVQVQLVGDGVSIEVADDGVGFDPAERHTGFGLAGIEERVFLAGGELEISTSPSGTTVRAQLPFAGLRPPALAGRPFRSVLLEAVQPGAE